MNVKTQLGVETLVERRLVSAMSRRDWPGIAAAVVTPTTSFAAGWGSADVAANRPVTAQTGFRTGSSGKTGGGLFGAHGGDVAPHANGLITVRPLGDCAAHGLLLNGRIEFVRTTKRPPWVSVTSAPAAVLDDLQNLAGGQQ